MTRLRVVGRRWLAGTQRVPAPRRCPLRWLLWLTFACLVFQDTVYAQSAPFVLRSIAFPLIGGNYLDDNPGWTPVAESIRQMKALGANDVKVTVSAGSYDSPRANLPNPTVNLNPSDEKILDVFRQMRAAGLQVTLQPFVHVTFDPSGDLLDSVHPQPTDIDAWMQAHTGVMVRWARLAQQAGVERFIVVGDERQHLAYGRANTAGWLSMIAQIRAVYTGQLSTQLYADGTVFAGGNTHVDLVDRAILDAVDLLGVGWFPQPLTNVASPSLAALVAAWRNTLRGVDTIAFLEAVHSRYGKPVWIADIALHSFSGDNIRNGDIYDVTIPLIADPQEQANEYESLLAVLTAYTGPWFLGASVDSWNRFPLDYRLTHRFLNSEYGENIRGKLAETVLRQWYSGQRGWAGMQAAATATGANTSRTLTAGLTVSPVDLGKAGNLYVAALLPNGSIYVLSGGSWRLFSGGAVPVYGTGALDSHSLPIFTNANVSAHVGTTILVGYGTDETDLLANRKYMAVYTIR